MAEPFIVDPVVEQPEIQVVCPSTRRAGHVLVDRVLDPEDFIVCVPESELEEYERAQPHLQYVTHPDSVPGLALKRQWIYDRWPNVLMLDDDVDHVIHVEHVGGEPTCKLRGIDAMDVFRRTAWEAKQAGCYLFSYGDGDIRNFEDMKPYKFGPFIAGSALGMLEGSGLHFNGELVAADDYWISLMNAHKHRICWIDWRYCPGVTGQMATFSTPGGTSSLRTMETEKNDTLMLQRYFGEHIVTIKKDTVRAKIRHPWQRTVRLPYRVS